MDKRVLPGPFGFQRPDLEAPKAASLQGLPGHVGRNWADDSLPTSLPTLPEHPPSPKDRAAGSHSLPLLGQGVTGTEAGQLTLVFCTCQASF